MSANHWENLGLLMVVIGLVSCSTAQSPVLYPNAHLQQVGQAQADRDIATCRDLASQYVESTAGKDIAKNAAVSGRGAGLGAAIGSAAGGTAGAVRGTAKQIGPSRVYKSYVNRCLREKGYAVIGWQ